MSLVSWRESGLMFKVSVRQFVSKFKQKKKRRRKETCPPFFCNGNWDLCEREFTLVTMGKMCCN